MARGPRTSHRKDANHDSICAVFTRRGLLVLSLSNLGGGAPDALICNPFSWRVRLVEIKTAKGKIRTTQSKFQEAGWPVRVIRDEAGAEQLANELIGS